MPEIDEKCIFIIKPDQAKFTTQTNGDTVTISGLNLSKEQAASLAWLVNQSENLKIRIKVDI